MLSGGLPGEVRVYTGKNDFWGIRDVPSGGCPYTIMSGGWATFQLPPRTLVPSPANRSNPAVQSAWRGEALTDEAAREGRGEPVVWSGSQELLQARVNASAARGGVTLSTSTVVTVPNVALTRLTVTHDTAVLVTLSIKLAYDAFPFRTTATFAEPDQGSSGNTPTPMLFGENTHRRLNYASLLPCDESAVVWPSVRSVTLTDAGVLEVSNGTLTTCIALLDNGDVVHDADGASCGSPRAQWTKQPSSDPRGGVLLVNKANTSLCASYGNGTPTDFGSRRVTAVPCSTAQPWILGGAAVQAADTSLFEQPGQTQCLAAAPPNYNNSLAQGWALVDTSTGERVPLSAMHSTNPTGHLLSNPEVDSAGSPPASVNFTVHLQAGRVYTVAFSAVTSRDVDGVDPSVTAVELATAAARNASALQAEHAAWWAEYWRAGATVTLGEKRLLLEGWWYGAQYLFGSATRPGKVAPGLWGPWVSGGAWVAWNGDYTSELPVFCFLVWSSMESDMLPVLSLLFRDWSCS